MFEDLTKGCYTCKFVDLDTLKDQYSCLITGVIIKDEVRETCEEWVWYND